MPMSFSSHTPLMFADLGSFNPTLMLLAVAGLLMLIRKPPNRDDDKIRVRVRRDKR